LGEKHTFDPDSIPHYYKLIVEQEKTKVTKVTKVTKPKQIKVTKITKRAEEADKDKEQRKL